MMEAKRSNFDASRSEALLLCFDRSEANRSSRNLGAASLRAKRSRPENKSMRSEAKRSSLETDRSEAEAKHTKSKRSEAASLREAKLLREADMFRLCL